MNKLVKKINTIKGAFLRRSIIIVAVISFLLLFLFGVLYGGGRRDNRRGDSTLNDEILSNSILSDDLLEKGGGGSVVVKPQTPISNNLSYVESTTKIPTEFSENELLNARPSMVGISYVNMDLPNTMSVVNAISYMKKGNDIEYKVDGDGEANLISYIQFLNSSLKDSVASFGYEQVSQEEYIQSGYEFSKPLVRGKFNVVQTIYLLKFNNSPIGRVDQDLYIVRTNYLEKNNSTLLLPDFFPRSVKGYKVDVPDDQLSLVSPIFYEGYGAFDHTLKYNLTLNRENFDIKDDSGFVFYLLDTSKLTLNPILSKKALAVGSGMSGIDDYFILGVVGN